MKKKKEFAPKLQDAVFPENLLLTCSSRLYVCTRPFVVATTGHCCLFGLPIIRIVDATVPVQRHRTTFEDHGCQLPKHKDDQLWNVSTVRKKRISMVKDTKVM